MMQKPERPVLQRGLHWLIAHAFKNKNVLLFLTMQGLGGPTYRIQQTGKEYLSRMLKKKPEGFET